MIWMYRKDLFAKYASRMKKSTSGSTRCPRRTPTWEQYYEIAKWFNQNASSDVPYGHGHMAKQHDSLMNDFSNVLWAWGGDYFVRGTAVGGLGLDEPRRADVSDPAEGGARRRLLQAAPRRSRIPGSRGWDWTALGAAFSAGQMAMDRNWHEFAAANEAGRSRARSATRPLPRGPSARANMYGGTGLGINAAAPETEQTRGVAVRQLGDLEADRSSPTSRARSAAARRRATPSTSSPRSQKARKPPSSMPNILTSYAVFGPGSRRTSACAQDRRPGTSATRRSSSSSRRCSPASRRRPPCWTTPSSGMQQAIDNAKSLETPDGATPASSAPQFRHGGGPRARGAVDPPSRAA